MALILNIETTTDTCSISLSDDGSLLSLVESGDKNAHSEKITSFVSEVLNKSGHKITDIDAVALSKGPGSYTGLRIGTAAAKAICFSLNKPLIGINTLKAIATASIKEKNGEPGFYFAFTDARREDVYAEVYDELGNCVLESNFFTLSEDFFLPYLKKKFFLSGTGVEKAIKYIKESEYDIIFPKYSASHLIDLAELSFKNVGFENLAYFEPYYLKPPHITQPNHKNN